MKNEAVRTSHEAECDRHESHTNQASHPLAQCRPSQTRSHDPTLPNRSKPTIFLQLRPSNKSAFQELKEPSFIQNSLMQQANAAYLPTSNQDDLEELKRALLNCFKCSNDVADAYAQRLSGSAVPEGQDKEDWLLGLAWEAGISDLGLSGLQDSIPVVVSSIPTIVKIKEFGSGFGGKYGDKEVISLKAPYGSQAAELLAQLAFQPILSWKRLLFRGVGGAFLRDLHLQNNYAGSYGLPRFSSSGSSEEALNFNGFGTGVYCTFDVEYALLCAGSGAGAAILVYDWSDTKDLSVLFKTELNEWRKFVKRNICRHREDVANDLGPPEDDLDELYDCIQGRITKNYKAARSCNTPEPSEFTQVVVIRDYRKILGERLIGVIFLV